MGRKPLLLYLEIPFCPVHCRHCAKRALYPRGWRGAFWRGNGGEEREVLRKNPRRLARGEELAALVELGGGGLRERGLWEYLPGQWAFPGRECRFFELEAAGG